MIIFYLLLVGTCISVSILGLFIGEAYKMTKAQRPIKVKAVDYGLSRWELNKITKQVMKYDRNRSKRGYRW